MSTCDRAPSGSLYPREATWGTGPDVPHCRSCGGELRYSKLGRWEHRAEPVPAEVAPGATESETEQRAAWGDR